MIDLTVPASVTAPFVVATEYPVDDPVAVARGRVRLPLAAELLGSPLLRVRRRAAAESGYADLIGSAAWARPEEAHLLDKTRHHIVITGQAPPVSQPGHAQAAREIARVVAEACDGIVYDAWSHQVLPHAFRFGAEHPEFCLADDWLATFVTGEEGGDSPARERGDATRQGDLTEHGCGDSLAREHGDFPGREHGDATGDERGDLTGQKGGGSPARERGDTTGQGGGGTTGHVGGGTTGHEGGDATGQGGGGDATGRERGRLHLVTAGLHRFGFPELEAAAVPAGNLFAAVTLLRCLAVGLLDEHWAWLACNPGAPLRRVPAEAKVDGADVWRYWAAEPAGAAGPPVRVRLSPAPPDGPDALPYLVAGPPADFDAPAALWWNDVVDLAMPYVPEAPRRTAA